MPASAPVTARPPRLVLRFAVYSAIVLGLAWVVIFLLIRADVEQRAQAQANTIAAHVAERTGAILRPGDLERPVGPERMAELDRVFREELAHDVVRVKLWNPAGVVVYSNDRSLLGTRADERDAAEELALALSGQAVQEVAGLNDEGGSGENVRTLESWAPLHLEGHAEPAAAIEIFQEYGPVAATVRDTVTPIGAALGVALLLLLAALVPILRQVTRTLVARHRRLEEHASSLALALEERRQAEQRLTQAERNYRSLVEQLPLVTYVDRLDETSSSVYMSPQIEALTGYTASEWTIDPELFVKVLHPDDRERVLALHREKYAAAESFAAEYRLVAKDGRVVWVHDEVMIARSQDGRPLHAQGFLVDDTERQVARHELERSNAELSALHETALLLIDERDSERLLELIATRAGELVGTADTYVYLREGEHGDRLRVGVGTGGFAGAVGNTLHRGEGLAGRVLETGEPLAVDDYATWDGRHELYADTPFHAVVGVPLRSRQQVVGVLGVARRDSGRFDAEETALLSRFAHLASLALESGRLYAAAQEAELRYRQLVEHLPLTTYISGLDTPSGNVYVSPQVEQLLGYPAERWMREPHLLDEAVHPGDLERLLADAERLRTTGEPIRAEYRYVRADGRTVWVLDQTILVRDEHGEPAWVQGFLLDVTERKEAEEWRARLAAIVESSNDAIMSASLDLRFTSWNAGAERMFGYTADEVLGEPVTILMPPDHREEATAAIRRVVEEGEVVHFETVRTNADGEAVHVAYTYSPIRDSAGTVTGVSAIGQEITERKRAEAAILESEAKFRAFVESTEEWVWAADTDGIVTYSNPAVERILGWSAAEFEGRQWLDFVVEEERDEMWSAAREHAAKRSGWSGLVTRWQARDGGVRHLESTSTPVFDEGGELVGWRGTDRDVTHRIVAEAERERLLAAEQEAREYAEKVQQDLAAQNERLRELDRLKDEFIALVSHELRTPLTSIRGYTELLLDGEAGDLSDDQRQFLGVVERNAHRLLHLVGDLLFLAQVEAGKLVLDVGALDLGAVAAESVEAARPQAEARNVKLTLATGPVPLIAGDRARIGQLLDNLVSNAIKFTAEGGRVDVRVRTIDERAVVEVHDSGIGIPANEQELLFQRFYRTSTATEQAIQGTGLGLAISKAIVDAHAGRIDVESEEGAGTTFRVALPLTKPAAVPEREEIAL